MCVDSDGVKESSSLVVTQGMIFYIYCILTLRTAKGNKEFSVNKYLT